MRQLMFYLSLVLGVLFIYLAYYNGLLMSAYVKFATVEDPMCDVKKPFVCWLPEGRLGNQLCEYVHLLVINASYSVDIAMYPSMRKRLTSIFPTISVKQVCQANYNKCPAQEKQVQYPEVLKALNQSKPGDTFIVSGYPCDLKLILNAKKLWQQEFSVPSKLKAHAAHRLENMTARWRAAASSFNRYLSNLTLVGVHVRRSDYTIVLRNHHFGDEKLLPKQYYIAAFEHYRTRFTNVLFIILTEPKVHGWCRQNLIGKSTDVILADDKSSADQDLVMLSSFEHIIDSHGTFGLWGILLAHTLTVAYPHPEVDHKGNRYFVHEVLDAIRGERNDTEYIQVNFNKKG